MKRKVIIIGAGLGGLSASIYLARNGYNVEVYEKNPSIGGKAGSLEQNGFRFDTGPSLLTLPQVFEDLFKFAGKDISDYLKIKKLENTCRYFYEDGTILNAYSDINKFANEVQTKTKDSGINLRNFLNYSKKIYDNASDEFLYNSLEFNFNKILSFPKLFQIDSFRTMHQAIKSFFVDDKLIQLFDRYATYNGSNPFVAPATLNIIPWVEHGIGGFYVENGIYEIPKALSKLAKELGVKFYFNENVDEITKINNKVSGIKIDERIIESDYVISNVDVNFTFAKLLKDKSSAESKRYSKFKKSTSAIVFNWGIKGVHEILDIHNILFSSNYEKEFKDIFEFNKLPDDPTIYINISSKYCENDAPKDCENWFVLVNAPAIENEDIDWENYAINYKQIILNKIKNLTGIDLTDKILFEKILTPKDIETQTNSVSGALYGISSNSKFSAFFRQSSQSKTYKNLFFCGGSAHPGGGMPLVVISGRLAAEKIVRSEE